MVESLEEVTLSSNTIFEGKIVTLRVDRVRLGDGVEADREIVGHAAAVAVLPVLAEGNLVFVRQFRLATKQVLLEVPAGILNPDEDPLVAAKRELKEETGFTASEWTSLNGAYMTPGFCEEFIHIFLAKGLQAGESNWDPDERLAPCSFPVSEVDAMIKSGELKDAKSIIAVLLAEKLGLLG